MATQGMLSFIFSSYMRNALFQLHEKYFILEILTGFCRENFPSLILYKRGVFVCKGDFCNIYKRFCSWWLPLVQEDHKVQVFLARIFSVQEYCLLGFLWQLSLLCNFSLSFTSIGTGPLNCCNCLNLYSLQLKNRLEHSLSFPRFRIYNGHNCFNSKSRVKFQNNWP